MKWKIWFIRLIRNLVIWIHVFLNLAIPIVCSSYNYSCNVCCCNRNVKNVNYLVCSSMPPQLLWHNGTRNMNICWPNISNKARSEWIWKHATGYKLSFGWQCVVLVYQPNFPIFKHTGKIKNINQTKYIQQWYFSYICFIICKNL